MEIRVPWAMSCRCGEGRWVNNGARMIQSVEMGSLGTSPSCITPRTGQDRTRRQSTSGPGCAALGWLRAKGEWMDGQGGSRNQQQTGVYRPWTVWMSLVACAGSAVEADEMADWRSRGATDGEAAQGRRPDAGRQQKESQGPGSGGRERRDDSLEPKMRAGRRCASGLSLSVRCEARRGEESVAVAAVVGGTEVADH